MTFLKHALIGIAVYEAARFAAKYALNMYNESDLTRGLAMEPGADPAASFSGRPDAEAHDPWQNSLADDQLRAPDA